jgi:excisionase family DNA binding protein
MLLVMSSTTCRPADLGIMDVNDVAELLGYSVPHVYLLARQGKIPARKIGAAVRFLEHELRAWVEQSPSAAR